MGKSTISMAMFNSYVSLPEGIAMPQDMANPFTSGSLIRPTGKPLLGG